MSNSSDAEYDLGFAPAGPGVEYILGIGVTPENTVLQTAGVDLMLVQSGVLTFGPHQRRTMHAVFLGAEVGQAVVKACLPTGTADVHDPWVCKSIAIDVHRSV